MLFRLFFSTASTYFRNSALVFIHRLRRARSGSVKTSGPTFAISTADWNDEVSLVDESDDDADGNVASIAFTMGGILF